MTDDGIAIEADVATKLSPQPVHEMVAKLTAMISAKGMKLFAVIDQAAEARQVGPTLPETTLVLFGSPQAGTPVMAASPLSALDLPLKVLIWADGTRPRSPATHRRTGRQPPPHRRPGRHQRLTGALVASPGSRAGGFPGELGDGRGSTVADAPRRSPDGRIGQ
jgi:uncharacterized protein (DUF302 family)